MEDMRLSDTLAKEIGLRIRSRREELRLTRRGNGPQQHDDRDPLQTCEGA